MKDKEYKLNTVKDFLDVVTEDNLELLIQDFKMFLGMRLQIKNLKMSNIIKPKYDYFHWIDDGKHNATYTFIPEEKK